METRYRPLEEIFAKRREGLLKLARGEELTFEEKEFLYGFLNFETWHNLTKLLVEMRKGELSEESENLIKFLGLKGLDWHTIDRIRDGLHRYLERNYSRELKIHGRYINEAFDLAIKDAFYNLYEDYDCMIKVSKDSIFASCSNKRDISVRLKYLGAGEHKLETSGTIRVETYEYVPSMPDYDVKVRDGEVEISTDDSRFLETITYFLDGWNVECGNINEENGKFVVVCRGDPEDIEKAIDELKEEDYNLWIETSLDDIPDLIKSEDVKEIIGIDENIECTVLDAYHIRHEWGEWGYEGGGGDYLILSFSCQGKIRPTTPEEELEISERLSSLLALIQEEE